MDLDSVDEIVAQHELRGGILALAVSLAERLSSGLDGAMPVDNRLLDSCFDCQHLAERIFRRVV